MLLRVGVLVLMLMLASVGAATADPYFNSSEPGCGTDPNVLFCDDFESKGQAGAGLATPGDWYAENCDAANNKGGIGVRTKGWCGTIYADPISPPGAVDCAAGVTPFGKCAATSGVMTGAVGSRNMADFNFKGGEVSEFYLRFYRKNSSGYLWSGQKLLTFNHQAGSGGIFWGGWGSNCGAGAPSTAPPNLIMGEVGAPQCYGQNQGNNLVYESGRWYYIEIHVKLNSKIGVKDGISEWWGNDCGTAGTSCGSAPILRHRRTDVDWRAGEAFGNGATTGIGAIWFENWGNSGDGRTCGGYEPNCGSKGQEWYDQIKASKVGPIGFAGASQPPPVTSYVLTTGKSGTGSGTVMPATGPYAAGTIVPVTQAAATGSTFGGWSGACTGTGACSVTMDAAKSATATFTASVATGPPPAPGSPTFSTPALGPTAVAVTVSWAASAGATNYTWSTGFSDGTGYQSGTAAAAQTPLTMPYHPSGAATAAWFCDAAVGPGGTSGSACDGYTVPAKPIVPAAAAPTVASKPSCEMALTALPPDASGGWAAQFRMDAGVAVGGPVIGPNASGQYAQTVLASGSHLYYVDWSKGSTAVASSKATAGCP